MTPAALAYVGQTGSLRQRLSQLSVLYRDEIPFNDPHTAAPCLWVMRTVDGVAFEFSVAGTAGDVRDRMADECVLIAGHRAELGRSRTANFGRMPDGWVKSSGNNSRLRDAGRLLRGHLNPAASRSTDHFSVLDTGRAPTDPDWAGLAWSGWSPDPPRGPDIGVYRIRRAGAASLLYIGQGRIRARLASHSAVGAGVECSWAALPGRAPAQLLEVECDLIASHTHVTGVAPDTQFRGGPLRDR